MSPDGRVRTDRRVRQTAVGSHRDRSGDGDGLRTDGGGPTASNEFDVGRLVRLAAIVAVAVAAGRLIISLVRDLVAGGSLDLLSTLATNAIGVIGTTATLLAIGAVVLFGAKKSIVVRGAVVVYVAHLIDGFLSSFVRGLLSGYRPGVGFNTLVNPLSSVLFFLGVVATIRLYQGKTALPGVDIRI